MTRTSGSCRLRPCKNSSMHPGSIGPIEIAPYLSRLCETLATSMIGDTANFDESGWRRRQRYVPSGRESRLDRDRTCHECSEACVPRRIKSMVRSSSRMISIGTNWKLSVADNGIGKPDGVFAQAKTGLGTGIVKALSQQLDARLKRRPALRARPCRSLTPLSRRRQSEPRK